MKYIFCMIMILFQFIFSYSVYRKQDKRQAALKIPMLFISGVYFVIQVFVFFKWCIKFPERFQIYSYIIQLILLIVFLVIECVLFFSNFYINRIERQEGDNIREFREILQVFEIKKRLIKNENKAVMLDEVYKKMKYADPVSSLEIEQENKNLLDIIQKLDDSMEYTEFEVQCKKILDLLEIRRIKNIKEKG